MIRGALVLCGGRSTRMGASKALLPFGDELMLQRVVRLVSEAVSDVVVVARPEQELPELPRDVRVTHDEIIDQGPLGGIAPGLKVSRADAVYVTGCDVPFLNTAVVDLLFERLVANDVAVCETEGFTHPLAAVYRVSVLPVIERLLEKERRRPVYLFDEVPTVRIGDDELRRVDPKLDTLANLNTPEAYEAALQALLGETP